MARKTMTEQMDRMKDKRAGIKEDTMRDVAADKRGGVVPMKKTRKAKKP